MIYLDSSALVKRYMKEAGSNDLKFIMAENQKIATSKLAYPEILSAFMRKRRERKISRKALDAVLARFGTDWDGMYVVEFHDELLPGIKSLVEKYPLKGADAVHLSSALWLEHTAKEKVTFVASDESLLKAARAEKLKVINPMQNKPING